MSFFNYIPPEKRYINYDVACDTCGEDFDMRGGIANDKDGNICPNCVEQTKAKN